MHLRFNVKRCGLASPCKDRHFQEGKHPFVSSFRFPPHSPVDNCVCLTPVYQVFESVAKKYDVMNDMMSLGIHRAWKDLLIRKMHPLPGTQLLDVAGGTGNTLLGVLEKAEYPVRPVCW